MKISFQLLFYFISSIFLISQSTCTPRFDELWGTDLKNNNISFSKYRNKVVILYAMNPLLHHPEQEIKVLNSFYDQFHDRGLEIVGVSTANALLRVFDRRFFKYNFKFDMYSRKYAWKNIDEFFSVQPLMKLDRRYIHIILQDMKNFVSERLHTWLADPKYAYKIDQLKYDIEYYLTHEPPKSKSTS